MKCKNCDNQISENDKFCGSCGMTQVDLTEGDFNAILKFWISASKIFTIILGIGSFVFVAWGLYWYLFSLVYIKIYTGLALIVVGLFSGVAVGMISMFFYQLELVKKIAAILEKFNKK